MTSYEFSVRDWTICTSCYLIWFCCKSMQPNMSMLSWSGEKVVGQSACARSLMIINGASEHVEIKGEWTAKQHQSWLFNNEIWSRTYFTCFGKFDWDQFPTNYKILLTIVFIVWSWICFGTNPDQFRFFFPNWSRNWSENWADQYSKPSSYSILSWRLVLLWLGFCKCCMC